MPIIKKVCFVHFTYINSFIFMGKIILMYLRFKLEALFHVHSLKTRIPVTNSGL